MDCRGGKARKFDTQDCSLDMGFTLISQFK